jgi:hypothetical protein
MRRFTPDLHLSNNEKKEKIIFVLILTMTEEVQSLKESMSIEFRHWREMFFELHNALRSELQIVDAMLHPACRDEFRDLLQEHAYNLAQQSAWVTQLHFFTLTYPLFYHHRSQCHDYISCAQGVHRHSANRARERKVLGVMVSCENTPFSPSQTFYLHVSFRSDLHL